MFGHRIKLFKLLGFQVQIDASWLIIFVLITWSLAKGFFPHYYSDAEFSSMQLWILGVVGALGLFVSIILHELSHSLVARQFGISMKGITLFIFGGVAEMKDEPKTPKAEFFMAIVGPIASILIGVICFSFHQLAELNKWSVSIAAVLWYLQTINFVLAGFNLIPAFPLDGGRVFRAILWKIKKDLKYATRITANIGSVFGIVLVVLGVFGLISGNFIGGLWWILIGMFLRGAAKMSYQQLLMKEFLGGESVSRLMKTNLVTVTPNLSIREFVDDYVYQTYHKLFPVVEGQKLIGCVRTSDLKSIPKANWEQTKVSDILKPCSEENSISADCDAIETLRKMNELKVSRLIVTDQGKLVGIISLKDLLELMSLKMELESEA